MNSSIIRYILGIVIKLEGLFLFFPVIVSLIYQEQVGIYYAALGVLCLLIGFLMTRKKPKSLVFYLKEGCVATSLSWILLSLLGCLPFYLSGEIPSFTDALFETVSGFTTTGASILTDIEVLSRSALIWRSFTHWIGGMGVLVFILAVIPLSGGSNMNLMRAESPGPSVGKLVPRVKHTARILYIIYIGMTLANLIMLLFGKMPVFDAINAAFSTSGTGGLYIKNSSFSEYSPYIQWVTTIFMFLFGVNFNAYYVLLFAKEKKAALLEEVRWYFVIVFVACCIIFYEIYDAAAGVFSGITDAAFQVSAIITSTGFYSVDFDQWSQTCTVVFVLLMFIGGCSGSTSCGLKISRCIILVKTIFKELTSYIHPKSIKKIKFEGKPVEHDVVRACNVYFITYIIVFSVSLLLISFEGQDFTTTVTSAVATLNNTGPGFAKVGPTQNYGHFTDFSKYVMMFNMIAGRLELFPLFILFHPAAWKNLFTKRNIKK